VNLHILKIFHIHIGKILDGRTSLDQLLDISFNKQFKIICKAESIKVTNLLIKYLEETNSLKRQPKGENTNAAKDIF